MPTRLTKIVATLGPATGNRKSIKDLVAVGVNLFRLNLSHGDHEVLSQWIGWIREAEKELKTYVGILLDLQGPKIRVGEFKNGFIMLHAGQKVVFTTEKVMGNEELVPVQYQRFNREVRPGNQVYLDDGNICVQVTKISGRRVNMKVEVGGRLSNYKGLNMPDATIKTSSLTRKDKQDLKFGLRAGIDLVALSFPGSSQDIEQLRKLIRTYKGDAEIVAKIERKRAVKNLESIVKASDAVMVARGDLGIEIPLEDVPVVQQRILRECTRQAKPVIVATQMLESMITNPRPTRAEVSDISNAVLSCADAIMLSAETAVGKHPRAAVECMVKTARKMEAFQRQTERIAPWSWVFNDVPPINLGITYSANRMVELLHAKALVAFTETGGTARMVTAPNPMVPVFAFSPSLSRVRRLTLVRGIVPFIFDNTKTFLDEMEEVFKILKGKRLVKKGDRIVITEGIPPGKSGWTNVIRVEVVP